MKRTKRCRWGKLKKPIGNRVCKRKPKARGKKSRSRGFGGTATRTEVRSPTSTSTEVRSPTSTATEAYTAGNITVTGGAGSGATHVYLNPGNVRDAGRVGRSGRISQPRQPLSSPGRRNR